MISSIVNHKESSSYPGKLLQMQVTYRSGVVRSLMGVSVCANSQAVSKRSSRSAAAAVECCTATLGPDADADAELADAEVEDGAPCAFGSDGSGSSSDVSAEPSLMDMLLPLRLRSAFTCAINRTSRSEYGTTDLRRVFAHLVPEVTSCVNGADPRAGSDMHRTVK